MSTRASHATVASATMQDKPPSHKSVPTVTKATNTDTMQESGARRMMPRNSTARICMASERKDVSTTTMPVSIHQGISETQTDRNVAALGSISGQLSESRMMVQLCHATRALGSEVKPVVGKPMPPEYEPTIIKSRSIQAGKQTKVVDDNTGASNEPATAELRQYIGTLENNNHNLESSHIESVQTSAL